MRARVARASGGERPRAMFIYSREEAGEGCTAKLTAYTIELRVHLQAAVRSRLEEHDGKVSCERRRRRRMRRDRQERTEGDSSSNRRKIREAGPIDLALLPSPPRIFKTAPVASALQLYPSIKICSLVHSLHRIPHPKTTPCRPTAAPRLQCGGSPLLEALEITEFRLALLARLFT
eukprot:226918-Rhodomonas_salina.3